MVTDKASEKTIEATPHYCLLSLLLQQPSSLGFDPSRLLTSTVLWELKHMVRDSLLFKHLFSRVGNIDILHQDVPFVTQIIREIVAPNAVCDLTHVAFTNMCTALKWNVFTALILAGLAPRVLDDAAEDADCTSKAAMLPKQ